MSRRSILTVSPLLLAGTFAACSSSSESAYLPPTAAPAPGGAQPTFAKIVTADTPPPPISGGTLAVARDGRTVVASDPDRDLVYVVDVPSRTLKHSVKLAPGAEPGRVALDVHGKAHVALRSAGKVATVDLATGATAERTVCAAPRGIAYDATEDTVHVACADGDLVSTPLDGRAERRVKLDVDLRDVVVTKNKIYVSRFREADVLVLSRSGVLESKSATRGGNLGWRMVAAPPADPTQDPPDDEPAIVSQDPQNPTGRVPQGYYGSPAQDACAAPTITSTRLDLPGRAGHLLIPPAVLPVDLATNGREYAIVAAGNGHTPSLPQVFVYDAASPPPKGAPGTAASRNPDCSGMRKAYLPGQAIAAAFAADELIVQSREPAVLYVMSPDRVHVWKEIPLSDESREDTGHAIFHSNSGGFLACASCHAEGGEDGRTWLFLEGQRRTPSMRGTVTEKGPFHWDGSLVDIEHLVDFVFVTRMSGPSLEKPHVETLKKWLFRMPAPPRIEGPLAEVERGGRLFRERCETCHSGPSLTNGTTHDVGTGGAFKVPSLVGVRWRAPFLHNGCAKTLKDRFGSCGGGQHGGTFTEAEVSDLVSYLESL